MPWRLLARQLHGSGQASVPLYTAGDVDAGTTPVNTEASAALRRMGLLRVSYQGVSEVEPLVLAAVPVFAPFWGYRIGQLVLTDLRHSAEAGPTRPSSTPSDRGTSEPASERLLRRRSVSSRSGA